MDGRGVRDVSGNYTADSIRAASIIYGDCIARGQSSEEAMLKAVGRLIPSVGGAQGASDAHAPYLVSSEVCSDTEIAVARSCGRFFTIGSFGYVVRAGRSSPASALAQGTVQNGSGRGTARARAHLAGVPILELNNPIRDTEDEFRWTSDGLFITHKDMEGGEAIALCSFLLPMEDAEHLLDWLIRCSVPVIDS